MAVNKDKKLREFDKALGRVIVGHGLIMHNDETAPPLAVGQGRGVVVLERQRGTLGVVTPRPKPPELTQ